MRTGIFITLMAISISTIAFADDVKNQTNVYDDFRQWWKPPPNVTVDEEVTSFIKRGMANLLYPVDMSSLRAPENDAKFRDLIIVLQQQMGVPPTGVLTVDQFNRLAEASRNVNYVSIGLPGKSVGMGDDGSWASASGTAVGEDIPEPINFVRIFCYRARGTCEQHEAHLAQSPTPFLYLDVGYEYEIVTWTPSRVTAKFDAPCATSLMTMDVKDKQVTVVRVPHCAGALEPQDRPLTWKLVDGVPVTLKLGQDRMNKARMLIYPPAKRLMPTQ
jgi:hypothetical protein